MPAGRGTKKKKKKKEKAPEYDINDIVEVETEIDEARVQKVLKEPEGSSNNIRVAVRIRPPNQRELDCGASNIVVSKHGLQVMVGTCKEDTQAFTYDVVLMNAGQVVDHAPLMKITHHTVFQRALGIEEASAVLAARVAAHAPDDGLTVLAIDGGQLRVCRYQHNCIHH